MARKPFSKVGYAQLEALRIVWRLGEATVREVLEALPRKRRLAYTTVMTMMRMLEQKGYLTHTARDRTYVYRSTVDEDEVTRRLIRQVADGVSDGSPALLAAKLVQTGGLSDEQLLALRRLIDEVRRKERRP